MHRHLLGLNSPPPDHVFDRFATTLGLPQDWDGDAWVKSDSKGYFLRAWNVTSGRIAYGAGVKFDEARRRLLLDVIDGNRHVKFTTLESKPATHVEPGSS